MYNIQEDEGLVEIVKKCKYLYDLSALKSSLSPLFLKLSFFSSHSRYHLFPFQCPFELSRLIKIVLTCYCSEEHFLTILASKNNPVFFVFTVNSFHAVISLYSRKFWLSDYFKGYRKRPAVMNSMLTYKRACDLKYDQFTSL